MRRLFLGAAAACLLLASPAWAESQKPVCPGPAGHGSARCHAHVVTDDKGKPLGRPQPSQTALTPQDLWSAYGLTGISLVQAGRTIAIVDAFHYPGAASDLAQYRADASLPACPVGTCFKQLTPGSSVPSVDEGWNQEAALDLDMASAICPKCNLVLVEATTNAFTDLGAAVNYAAALTPTPAAISNSYGGNEFSGETGSYEGYYDHSGIAETVSSGDSGYGAEFPASSRYVTAVGGTSLRKGTNGAWTETAWSGAGSGCSRYVAKPTWQHDTGCANRT